ncbi:Na+/H+ antiporter NhaA [Streptomyces xiamenensis]
MFFFVVGNELKQELEHGEPRDPRRAALPIAAAPGGLAVPALILLAVNAGASGEAAGGWGIPMATDIAFALAVPAVVGRHLPAALRTLPLTLATVDDTGRGAGDRHRVHHRPRPRRPRARRGGTGGFRPPAERRAPVPGGCHRTPAGPP